MFDKYFKNSKQFTANVTNALNTAILWQRNKINELGKYFGGLRDIYKAMGYKRTINNEDYSNYYERNAVANAVVKAYPNACWRISPEITENEDPEDTQFEKDIDSLINDMHLFKFLKKADRLAGLYHYSIILIGISDSLNLDQPAGNGSIEYIQVYSEPNAQIFKINTDQKSPRFGQPETYKLTTSIGTGTTQVEVHHSRIVHIAEDPDCGDFFATPILKAVYNNIQNIEMISAANAEGYWRGGFAGIVAEIDKEASLSDADKTAYKEQMTKYVEGYERTLRIKGGKIKSINTDVKDPNPHLMSNIMMISIKTRIPQRVLMGSEQGKLASDQDSTTWIDEVAGRQVSFCDPDIVRAFIDKAIGFGAIAKPVNNEYIVTWKDLQDTDEKTIAETAEIKTKSLVLYGNSSGAQVLMPPENFYKQFLGMTKKQIDSIDIVTDTGADEVQGDDV